jgi:hypothetical protein
MKNFVSWHRLIFLSVGLLAGCASTPQYYPNTHEKNFTVNLSLSEKGGFMTTVNAYVGVNEIAGDCSSRYLGFVDLKDGANKLGLTPGKRAYLAVQISSSIGYSSSQLQRGTLITPVAGKQYEITANYVDGMFDFRLFEVTKSGKKELPIVPISACKLAKDNSEQTFAIQKFS